MVPVRSHTVMNLQPDGATAVLLCVRSEAPDKIRATEVRAERWRGARSEKLALISEPLSILWESIRNSAHCGRCGLFLGSVGPGFGSSSKQFTYRSGKDFMMKKKNRIQIASQIIAQLKREMQEPRLTESVRNGISLQARSDKKEPAVRLARA